MAQQPAGPPRPTPKPGYVQPPENSAGLYPINGEPIFKAKCAACHAPAIDRAPTKEQLEARSPEEVYDALTGGAMKTIGAGMTPAEIYGVVRFLTGKSPTPQTAQGPTRTVCARHGPMQAAARSGTAGAATSRTAATSPSRGSPRRTSRG
jgi:cytochrome c